MIRLGIIGAGEAGTRHAIAARQHKGVSVVAIHDPNRQAASGLAARSGADVVELSQLLDVAEAVVIASPAATHATLCFKALEARCHVMVERPVATSLGAAKRMLEEATADGLVLASTHSLGWVESLPLPKGEIRGLTATRELTVRDHIVDVGVVLDVMMPDLFAALHLLPGRPVSVKARKLAGRDGVIDAAQASVRFSKGAMAEFVARRQAPERVITWELESVNDRCVLDFVEATYSALDDPVASVEGAQTFKPEDPFKLSMAAFCAAIEGNCTDVQNTLNTAIAALELGLRIDTSLEIAL